MTKSRLVEIKSLLREIDPTYKDYYLFYYDFLYGEMLFKENSVEKAISVFDKASPPAIPHFLSRYILPYNVPLLRDALARAYHKKGELDKAIAEYERLITFDPNSKDRRLIHPKYHYRLAKLYEEKGLSEKAVEEYEKFLEIWKDADEELVELVDAKARLKALKGISSR